MVTVVLQIVHSAVALAFGLLGLRVARRLRLQPLLATGWLWTAGVFAVLDTVSLAQSLAAAAAFASGPDTFLWNRYVAWAPALNHGRTAALIIAFPLLLVLVFPRRRVEYAPPPWRSWVAGCGFVIAGGGAGVWLGLMEGPIIPPHHFERVAVMNAVELLVLLAVLFLLLLRDRLDRLLWLALAVYALNVALHVLLISGLSGFGIAGGWQLPAAYLPLFNAVFAAAMLGLAAARLRRIGAGGGATGFFRPARRHVRMF